MSRTKLAGMAAARSSPFGRCPRPSRRSRRRSRSSSTSRRGSTASAKQSNSTRRRPATRSSSTSIHSPAAWRSSATRCARRAASTTSSIMNSACSPRCITAASSSRSTTSTRLQARSRHLHVRRHGLLRRRRRRRERAAASSCRFRSTRTSRCSTTASDLYQQNGLKVPDTWDELLANAKALHNPPQIYGIVQRGARGPHTSPTISFPTSTAFGGSVFRDERGRRLHRHAQQPGGQGGAGLLHRARQGRGPPQDRGA